MPMAVCSVSQGKTVHPGDILDQMWCPGVGEAVNRGISRVFLPWHRAWIREHSPLCCPFLGSLCFPGWSLEPSPLVILIVTISSLQFLSNKVINAQGKPLVLPLFCSLAFSLNRFLNRNLPLLPNIYPTDVLPPLAYTTNLLFGDNFLYIIKNIYFPSLKFCVYQFFLVST